MVYGEVMVAPMRKELTRLGITELRSPDDVDGFLEDTDGRTAMIVVNSVCGCASGSMRPALATALDDGVRPEAMGTVFAGQDTEATDRAREHFAPHPPSSPAIALFRDGELVQMMPRETFAGRDPREILPELNEAFDRHFGGADDD